MSENPKRTSRPSPRVKTFNRRASRSLSIKRPPGDGWVGRRADVGQVEIRYWATHAKPLHMPKHGL
jgi:hypothetical protein